MAGTVKGGSLDAANILKPALARGEIRCIGATTEAEFREYFSNDAALERRFQPIRVPEPSVETTIAILAGAALLLEKHHGVEFKDTALRAAAELTHRLIPERRLPDKAIELLDRAAAALHLESVLPSRVSSLRSRLHEAELRLAILRRDDPSCCSAESLALDEMRRATLCAIEHEERIQRGGSAGRARAIELRLDLEQAREEESQALVTGDLTVLAELRHSRIPDLERELAAVDCAASSPMSACVITAEIVAEALSRWRYGATRSDRP